MKPPRPTRRDLDAIGAELLRIESESPRWSDDALDRLLGDLPGSWPVPDGRLHLRETSEPIDSLNLKREYVTPCGHKIAAKSEIEELRDVNQQIYEAFTKVSIEARDLRRALRRSDAQVVIVALAGIALTLIVALGMRL